MTYSARHMQIGTCLACHGCQPSQTVCSSNQTQPPIRTETDRQSNTVLNNAAHTFKALRTAQLTCKSAVGVPVMEVGVLAVSSSGWGTSVPASAVAAGESKIGWRRRDRASFGAYANSVSRSIEAISGVAADFRADRRTGVTTCTGSGLSPRGGLALRYLTVWQRSPYLLL